MEKQLPTVAALPRPAPTFNNYLHLHFIVLLWGFTAISGRLISIPPVELVLYRTALALVGLGGVLYARGLSPRLGRVDVGRMLATGALLAGHWMLFFGAARVANVSVCLAGMATASLWTSLLEPLLGRKRISGLEVLLGVVIMGGLYLIFRFEFSHGLGLLMAIGSAMLAAIFSIVNSQLSQRHEGFVITFYEMAGALVFTLLLLPLYAHYAAPPGGLRLLPTPADCWHIAFLALVCTVYAYSASVQLLRTFSAFAMSLTINLEPVYGIGLAVLVFGESERMTPGFYGGTLIILLAVLLYPTLARLTATGQRT